jgi:cytochrome c peroxidase
LFSDRSIRVETRAHSIPTGVHHRYRKARLIGKAKLVATRNLISTSVEDYWKATGSKEIDEGRALATKNPEDKYVFKVPTLRNVAMTGPYFHDGSVASLPDAVKTMARVQLGATLGDKEVSDIVAFLGSLTGPLPKGFATSPVLPPEH